MGIKEHHKTVANGNLAEDFEGTPKRSPQLLKNELLFEVAVACGNLLSALRIDYENDPQSRDTPERMARMYVNELLKGRYEPKPDLKEFENTKNFDQLYIVGPVSIRSLCSHHMIPFIGQAWLGLLPDPQSNLLGLSKFSRLAEWVFARPQIQEEATAMLADEIQKATNAPGVAVIVKAQHQCMTLRGVRDTDAFMVTSQMVGLFRTKPDLRAEFLSLIK